MGTQLYRHGDVVIEAVEKPRNLGEPRKPDARGAVLAEGERTGHHHRVQGAKVWDMDDGTCVLEVPEGGGTLVHEEHLPIKLSAGCYRTYQKRAYTEGDAGWAPVQD